MCVWKTRRRPVGIFIQMEQIQKFMSAGLHLGLFTAEGWSAEQQPPQGKMGPQLCSSHYVLQDRQSIEDANILERTGQAHPSDPRRGSTCDILTLEINLTGRRD